MILNIILWYLIVALAGWLAFPLSYRFLQFLPDRGLAAARPLGLLLWGYAYWLLVSLNVLQNDTGGVLLALLVVAGLSAWGLWRGGIGSITSWLRERRGLVLSTELVFLALFVLWAVVRAANPDATGTEKPMELAFINAILRSPAFPPADPWLSGYAISYYYFGYVIVAALARLSAVPGATAFNLALATWFALTGLGAYGLVYNLLALRHRGASNIPVKTVASLKAPVFAPLFLLLVSNLEGFLEMLHARGLFWQKTGDTWQSGFWKWLNIQEIVQPPTLPFSWQPERVGGIWWWRASRVLQDFDWNGQSREIIDEFPAFSYLLGDLHPHVLAMPFVLLAVALALNIYLQMRGSGAAHLDSLDWIRRPDFWLTAVILGGLSFLNTWDFPIYLALFAAAAVLPGFLRSGIRWSLLGNLLEILIGLGIAGIVLYLPFYLGFASQANGLMPSLIFFTRGVYLWVMFGSLLVPIFAWLVWSAFHREKLAWRQALVLAGGLVGGLWALSSLLGAWKLNAEPSLAGIFGAAPGAPLVLAALTRRLAAPGDWLTIFLLLLLIWALLGYSRGVPQSETDNADAVSLPASRSSFASSFVLLLLLLGTGLVLFPEFFYLRDQFGWRMNTIFKFYFQAWIVWAIGAAYASVVLWQELKTPIIAVIYRAGLGILLVISLVYPLFGILDRTNGFAPAHWTLDGAAYMASYAPGEQEAIQWLQSAPYGVIAEAASLSASYTGYARVSTLTGLPAVLGWPGHESQWRGGAVEMGSREPDIAQLYKARTWDQALGVLEKYNIRYVFVGSMERSQYRPNTTLFQKYMETVYETPSVTIYQAPRYSLLARQAVQP